MVVWFSTVVSLTVGAVLVRDTGLPWWGSVLVASAVWLLLTWLIRVMATRSLAQQSMPPPAQGRGPANRGRGPRRPPDDNGTLGDGVPRRPRPGDLSAGAEAAPEPDDYRVDVREHPLVTAS